MKNKNLALILTLLMVSNSAIYADDTQDIKTEVESTSTNFNELPLPPNGYTPTEKVAATLEESKVEQIKETNEETSETKLSTIDTSQLPVPEGYTRKVEKTNTESTPNPTLDGLPTLPEEENTLPNFEKDEVTSEESEIKIVEPEIENCDKMMDDAFAQQQAYFEQMDAQLELVFREGKEKEKKDQENLKRAEEALKNLQCPSCIIVEDKYPGLVDTLLETNHPLFKNRTMLERFLSKIVPVIRYESGNYASDAAMFITYTLEAFAEHALNHNFHRLDGEVIKSVLNTVIGDDINLIPGFGREVLDSIKAVNFNKDLNGDAYLNIYTGDFDLNPNYDLTGDNKVKINKLKSKQQFTLRIKKVSDDKAKRFLADRDITGVMHQVHKDLKSSGSNYNSSKLGSRLLSVEHLKIGVKASIFPFAPKYLKVLVTPGIKNESGKLIQQSTFKAALMNVENPGLGFMLSL